MTKEMDHNRKCDLKEIASLDINYDDLMNNIHYNRINSSNFNKKSLKSNGFLIAYYNDNPLIINGMSYSTFNNPRNHYKLNKKSSKSYLIADDSMKEKEILFTNNNYKEKD